jgi:hypothetical protein
MNENESDEDFLHRIFFARQNAHEAPLFEPESNFRLAHYTSAQVGLSIIKKQELWMRNARLMEDWSELSHGFEKLLKHLGRNTTTANGQRLIDKVCEISHDIWSEATNRLTASFGATHSHTYLACFTQHDIQEERDGRLSMWRAFGGIGKTDAVALVIRPPFANQATRTVFRTKVEYFSSEQFEEALGEIANSVSSNADRICKCPKYLVAHYLFEALLDVTLSLKHPAFKEEKEWRIYHTQNGALAEPEVENCVEVIRGTPQTVMKLRFGELAREGHSAYALNSIIENVIVGPSPYQDMIRNVFIEELDRHGVLNASQRVTKSGIPIRVSR